MIGNHNKLGRLSQETVLCTYIQFYIEKYIKEKENKKLFNTELFQICWKKPIFCKCVRKHLSASYVLCITRLCKCRMNNSNSRLDWFSYVYLCCLLGIQMFADAVTATYINTQLCITASHMLANVGPFPVVNTDVRGNWFNSQAHS